MILAWDFVFFVAQGLTEKIDDGSLSTAFPQHFIMQSAVLSIRDIPYQFQTDTVYHSCTTKASAQRLVNSTPSWVSRAIRYAMQQPAAKRVWAIIVEQDEQPMFVLQNTQYSLVPLAYRRVLRVREEYLEPNL